MPHLDGDWMYLDSLIDTVSRFAISSLSHKATYLHDSVRFLVTNLKNPRFSFFLIHWQFIWYCLCNRDVVKIFFSLMRRIFSFYVRFLRNGNHTSVPVSQDKKNLHMHALCSATYFCYLNVTLTLCKISVILDDSRN